MNIIIFFAFILCIFVVFPNCAADTNRINTNGLIPQFIRIDKYQYWIEDNVSLNWFAAMHECRKMGGDLASIETEHEMNALSDYLISKGSRNPYWISGNRLSAHREFSWLSTGQPITYSNWNIGEPNNAEGNEYCIDTFPKNNRYVWNDGNCHHGRNYICEINEACVNAINTLNQTFMIFLSIDNKTIHDTAGLNAAWLNSTGLNIPMLKTTELNINLNSNVNTTNTTNDTDTN